MGGAADECGSVPKVAQNGQDREFGRQISKMTIKFCGRTNSSFRFGIIKRVYGAILRALGLRIDSECKLEQINSRGSSEMDYEDDLGSMSKYMVVR